MIESPPEKQLSRDTHLTESARNLLDAHADDLPESVVHRLAIGRRRALTKDGSRTVGRGLFGPWQALAAGCVAALIVAAVVLVDPMTPNRTVVAQDPIQDLDILSAQAELDLLEELEFMAWVADQWADAG